MKKRKQVLYLSSVVIVGLLPAIIALVIALFDKQYSFDWNKFLLEFGLGFFCTATVGSVAIEFLFTRQTAKNLPLIMAVYGLFPACVIGTATLVYCITLVGNPDNSLVVPLQFVLFIMALVYIYYTKIFKLSR